MSIYIETSKSSILAKAEKVICRTNELTSPNNLSNDGKHIVKLVSEFSNVPYDLFFHQSRCKAQIANARQLAMYLMHVGLGKSMSEVGRFFGRDRTTVSHACALIEDKRDDLEFDEMLCHLEDRLETISFAPNTIKSNKNEQNIQH